MTLVRMSSISQMGIATNMLDIPILKLQGYIFSIYIYTHIQRYRKEMSCYPQQWTDAEQKSTGLMQHEFAKNKKQKTLGFTT